MSEARLGISAQPQSGELANVVGETLACVEALQNGPVIPLIPVVYRSEAQPFGRYVPGDGKPERIELSEFGPHPHLTLAHEIGHLLDHALLAYNGYASRVAVSPLRDVMRTIERSTAYRELREIQASGRTQMEDRIARRRAVYWLEPEELWARTYAQWVAVRSHNETLRAELALSRRLEVHSAASYVQWNEEDFVPIADAIDEVFQNLGWLR